MSLFPYLLTINVINSKTGNPIPNIAVKITLFARHKNDYSFILPFTDKNGKIAIDKNWIIQNIDQERKINIMDYSSTLEDCEPKFLFQVLDKDDVSKAVKGYKLWQEAYNISQEYIDTLSSVDNHKYIACSELCELKGQKEITVKLSIKEKE